MCRLVAGYAWSPDGAVLLGKLAVLVAEAAMGDPYLAAVTGGENRHCHGYGFVLAYRGVNGGAWRLAHERFDAARRGLGEEEACRENLEAARGAAERLRGLLSSASEAFIVFHVRRAGRREPRGSLNAHPYVSPASSRAGQRLLYLAHNGGLHKEALAAELGVDVDSYTDSHLLLLWIMRRVAEGESPPDALAAGYVYAKSGYDVAVLEAVDDMYEVSLRLYVAAGYVPGLDEAKRRYYEPVGFAGNGATGYISSTVRDLAERKGLEIRTWVLGHGVYRVAVGGLEGLGGLRR